MDGKGPDELPWREAKQREHRPMIYNVTVEKTATGEELTYSVRNAPDRDLATMDAWKMAGGACSITNVEEIEEADHRAQFETEETA